MQEFARTHRGAKFFDHDVPELVTAIQRLADAVVELTNEVEVTNDIERQRLEWEQEKEALG